MQASTHTTNKPLGLILFALGWAALIACAVLLFRPVNQWLLLALALAGLVAVLAGLRLTGSYRLRLGSSTHRAAPSTRSGNSSRAFITCSAP